MYRARACVLSPKAKIRKEQTGISIPRNQVAWKRSKNGDMGTYHTTNCVLCHSEAAEAFRQRAETINKQSGASAIFQRKHGSHTLTMHALECITHWPNLWSPQGLFLSELLSIRYFRQFLQVRVQENDIFAIQSQRPRTGAEVRPNGMTMCQRKCTLLMM